MKLNVQCRHITTNTILPFCVVSNCDRNRSKHFWKFFDHSFSARRLGLLFCRCLHHCSREEREMTGSSHCVMTLTMYFHVIQNLSLPRTLLPVRYVPSLYGYANDINVITNSNADIVAVLTFEVYMILCWQTTGLHCAYLICWLLVDIVT
jgi:branched-subunit amino acid transport protein AzlD